MDSEASIQGIRPAEPPGRPIAITSVTLIDTGRGRALPDRTVVVGDGRVGAVGPAWSVELPENAAVIEGRGKFLIPGLWDMHSHYGSTRDTPYTSMPLFLANGVTGVRDLCSNWYSPDGSLASLEVFQAWQAAVNEGRILGPRLMQLGSHLINGLEDLDEGAPTFWGAATEEDARRLVRYYHDLGADYLKVYSKIPRQGYFALVDEANKLGMPFAGHKPFAVSSVEAAQAGQRSFEHVLEILFDFYPGGAELRRTNSTYFHPTVIRRQMIDQHDYAQTDEAFAVFVEQDTYLCPTHLTRKFDALAGDPAFRDDPRLRYVDREQRGDWLADADRMVGIDPSPEGRRAFKEFYELGLDFIGRANAAGVKILAGTDANDSYCFPGFGLHDELEELVAAGLTPGEALRAATLTAAEFLGVEADYGSVAPGKVADLLLLGGNPLAEIGNTRRIEAVCFNGAVYGRQALDQLLVGVERYVGALIPPAVIQRAPRPACGSRE
jgi:hypothetical protein